MATMAEIWNRIHEWMEKNAPQLFTTLRPGVNDEQLKNLEEKLELNDLPEDFKDCYQIHDGSTAGCFFGASDNNNTFHSIEDIIQDWTVNKGIVDTQGVGEYERHVEEPLEIQSIWWSPRWIPFGGNGCGDLLSLDLAPTEAGTFGQVIQCFHDGAYFQLLASSITEFLTKFANDLEDGKYEVSEDGTGLMYKELSQLIHSNRARDDNEL